MADATSADSFAGQVLRFSFEMDPDGTPASLSHNVESMDSGLPWVGALPEGWVEDDCIEMRLR